MIYNTFFTPTDSDNVVSLTEPRLSHLGFKKVRLSDVTHGFHPKSRIFSVAQERLQIASLEELFGVEYKSLRECLSETQHAERYLNPNPIDWMNKTGEKSSYLRVHMWWLDMMYVLSQTLPEVAKDFFVSLDDACANDPKLKKELKSLCRNRIHKVSRKKLSKLSDGTLSPENAAILQDKIVTIQFWKVIGANLGMKYVNSFHSDILNLEPLLLAHMFSELAIPTFAEMLLGEEWRETSMTREDAEKTFYNEIGDLATIYGMICVYRNWWTDEEYENSLNSTSMSNYFSDTGINCLKALLGHTNGGGCAFTVNTQNI